MPALEVQEVPETVGQPADAGQLCFQLDSIVAGAGSQV